MLHTFNWTRESLALLKVICRKDTLAADRPHIPGHAKHDLEAFPGSTMVSKVSATRCVPARFRSRYGLAPQGILACSSLSSNNMANIGDTSQVSISCRRFNLEERQSHLRMENKWADRDSAQACAL